MVPLQDITKKLSFFGIRDYLDNYIVHLYLVKYHFYQDVYDWLIIVVTKTAVRYSVKQLKVSSYIQI